MTMLTREELEKHNSRESCWIALHDSVYDVTGMLFVRLYFTC